MRPFNTKFTIFCHKIRVRFSIFTINNPLVQASAAQRLKYDAGRFLLIGYRKNLYYKYPKPIFCCAFVAGCNVYIIYHEYSKKNSISCPT